MAVDDDLNDREALFGATRAQYEWIKGTGDREHGDEYLAQFVPLEEVTA